MIGIQQIIFSSVGGALFTILINGLIKRHEKNESLKSQVQIFVKFIDDVIIKYLIVNRNEYEKILGNNDEELFSSRTITESPMLNRGIFDFFEKSDLIKIFSYCNENSLVDVYHYFYEIDFLQKNSPQNLLTEFKAEIENHYDLHKKSDETFEEHISYCASYNQSKVHFKVFLSIQNEHTKLLIDAFQKIKIELKSIDELNDE